MPRYDTYATPRADLGAALLEYTINRADYVGIQALPITPTIKQAASFTKITRESLLRVRQTRRAPGSGYNRDNFDGEDQAYTCEEYGQEVKLDDGDRARFASDFDAEYESSQLALDVVLREQERRISALLFNTSTWTGSTLYTDDSSAYPWTTTATDVVSRITAACEKVRTLTGLWPNSLLLNHTNLMRLVNNDDLITRVGVTTKLAGVAALTASLGPILGFDQILVGKGMYNTADEGQTFTGAAVWSNLYAMVGVFATGPALFQPCVGRTMLWTGDTADNATVEQYRDEPVRSEIFRARQFTDELVFDASFAHLVKVATS